MEATGEDTKEPPLLVIWDLDGTLLDSERLVQRVAKHIVERHGAAYTAEVAHAGMGMRPREATAALIEAAGLTCGVDELMAEAQRALEQQWSSVQLMPGAERALRHLCDQNVPMALATSSPRDSVLKKIAPHPIFAEAFRKPGGTEAGGEIQEQEQEPKPQGEDGDEWRGGSRVARRPAIISAALLSELVVVTGDDVARGKPAPDIFLAAMRQSGVTADPRRCLVVEDSAAGVQAGIAAGMRVIAVPSVLDFIRGDSNRATEFVGAEKVLNSLYDWKPDVQLLPAFEDLVQCRGGGESSSTLPSLSKGENRDAVVPILPPWRVKGPVVKGYGRGSKMLGIPTANLPPSAWDAASSSFSSVAPQASGIYCGWASVGDDPAVYPMALSIGWNPHFDEGIEQKHQSLASSSPLLSPLRTDSHSKTGKTLEPWLLHDFGPEGDFYGEELRIVVVGYIRPEAPFTTLEALVDRIHRDGRVTEDLLLRPRPTSAGGAGALRQLARDPFLRPAAWAHPSPALLLKPLPFVLTASLALLGAIVVTGPESQGGTVAGALIGPARRLAVVFFGSFARLRILNTIAWIAHICEATVAFCTAFGRRYRLGLAPSLGWAGLTLCCGYAALGVLRGLDKASPLVRPKRRGVATYMDNVKPFNMQPIAAISK